MRRVAAPAALLGLVLLPLSGHAQLPAGGIRSLALGGGGIASPSGAEAIALNAAAAALPGNPRFSVAVLPLSAGWNVNPLGLSELSDYGGGEIPVAVRESWLQRIGRAGSLSGNVGAVTGVALQAGAVGFQVSSSGHGGMSLNEPAAELLLFGNAGRTGEPASLDLEGSYFDAGALTTVGVSWAMPLTGPRSGDPSASGNRSVAVGALATYSMGHFVLLGRDLGSRLHADPVGVDILFPVIHGDPDSGRPALGRGIGLTLSAAWAEGPWSVGAVIHDALNTFRWNERALAFRSGEATVDGDRTVSDFESRPLSEAPDPVRRLITSRSQSPRVTVGGSWEATETLHLFADGSRGLGEALIGEPRSRMGVATEFLGVSRVPLRAGISAISGGIQAAGGLGFRIRSWELAGGALHRTGDRWGETSVGVSITVQWH